MRFESEEELRKRLLGILAPRIDSGGKVCQIEFESPNGIADVVLATLTDGWEDRLRLGGIKPAWAYALLQLSDEGCSAEDFASFVGVTKATAKRVLKSYEEAGFCNFNSERKHWKKLESPKALVAEFCAIETKLKNWRRALYQASRYRDFAHQAWVVMDDRDVSPALRNLAEFSRLNIGLASIATAGDAKIHAKPTLRSPRSELRFWYANTVVAQRLLRNEAS